MSGYVMGIDGGATKSHLALFDLNGEKIGFIEWGPLNHSGMKRGFVELGEQLEALIDTAERKYSLKREDMHRGVFGMAGLDTKREEKIIGDLFSQCGLKNFLVCNDAYLPIKAGSRQGHGVCAISGTGCSIVGTDPEGHMVQIGAHGGLTGDSGGGYYLGEQAVRAVYAHLFKRGPYTVMKETLFKQFDIQHELTFIDVLVDTMAERHVRLSDLNRVVFEAANAGDEVARGILKASGEDYAYCISSAIRYLSFPADSAIDIVLAGSIHTKGDSPLIIDTLKEVLRRENPDRAFSFALFDKPPVAGAVVWALEDVLAPEGLADMVCRQL